jgi:hypothetical protein
MLFAETKIMISGVYYRIKRNDKYRNVDFAEMTSPERRYVMSNLERVELENLVMILSDELINKSNKIANFTNVLAALNAELMEE